MTRGTEQRGLHNRPSPVLPLALFVLIASAAVALALVGLPLLSLVVGFGGVAILRWGVERRRASTGARDELSGSPSVTTRPASSASGQSGGEAQAWLVVPVSLLCAAIALAVDAVGGAQEQDGIAGVYLAFLSAVIGLVMYSRRSQNQRVALALAAGLLTVATYVAVRLLIDMPS